MGGGRSPARKEDAAGNQENDATDGAEEKDDGDDNDNVDDDTDGGKEDADAKEELKAPTHSSTAPCITCSQEGTGKVVFKANFDTRGWLMILASSALLAGVLSVALPAFFPAVFLFTALAAAGEYIRTALSAPVADRSFLLTVTGGGARKEDAHSVKVDDGKKDAPGASGRDDEKKSAGTDDSDGDEKKGASADDYDRSDDVKAKTASSSSSSSGDDDADDAGATPSILPESKGEKKAKATAAMDCLQERTGKVVFATSQASKLLARGWFLMLVFAAVLVLVLSIALPGFLFNTMSVLTGVGLWFYWTSDIRPALLVALLHPPAHYDAPDHEAFLVVGVPRTQTPVDRLIVYKEAGPPCPMIDLIRPYAMTFSKRLGLRLVRTMSADRATVVKTLDNIRDNMDVEHAVARLGCQRYGRDTRLDIQDDVWFGRVTKDWSLVTVSPALPFPRGVTLMNQLWEIRNAFDCYCADTVEHRAPGLPKLSLLNTEMTDCTPRLVSIGKRLAGRECKDFSNVCIRITGESGILSCSTTSPPAAPLTCEDVASGKFFDDDKSAATKKKKKTTPAHLVTFTISWDSTEEALVSLFCNKHSPL